MVSVGESFNLPHYLCSAFLKHILLRIKLINDCWICKLPEVWAHKNLDNKVGGKKGNNMPVQTYANCQYLRK